MDEVRWLNAEERATWLRLVAVLNLLPTALDAQLHRDEDLTLFEYYCLAMLSEAPERKLRMTALAARTNATLPRLSRAISGLEHSGLVVREPCPEDRRATNAVLTPAGWDKIVQAAPGHVTAVRELVLDPLTPAQLAQLGRICERLLVRLDPDGRMLAALE
ncbi:MAG TPA: MarR family transcriptional regulator [Propionibacteriaceae bacterium]|nr:MarR family transcriptional regulator [Propionibacteriaceae bacterium]